MLRLAARLFLAFALVLNGFAMPMSAAAHGVEGRGTAQIEGASRPCHDGMPDMASMEAHSTHAAHHGGKSPDPKPSVPCCDHSQCHCGCLVSTPVTSIAHVAPVFAPVARQAVLVTEPLAAAHTSVPLRPPIA